MFRQQIEPAARTLFALHAVAVIHPCFRRLGRSVSAESGRVVRCHAGRALVNRTTFISCRSSIVIVSAVIVSATIIAPVIIAAIPIVTAAAIIAVVIEAASQERQGQRRSAYQYKSFKFVHRSAPGKNAFAEPSRSLGKSVKIAKARMWNPSLRHLGLSPVGYEPPPFSPLLLSPLPPLSPLLFMRPLSPLDPRMRLSFMRLSRL